uniref:Uncharacterized protein n=1 Tax=Desertifilum tharense IPPAS B-1220 TaxID=1781255 RepID=A0ACD5H0Y3_9CYAN
MGVGEEDGGRRESESTMLVLVVLTKNKTSFGRAIAPSEAIIQ